MRRYQGQEFLLGQGRMQFDQRLQEPPLHRTKQIISIESKVQWADRIPSARRSFEDLKCDRAPSCRRTALTDTRITG